MGERVANTGTMKIGFICGSLEPGKSGVGDYTLLLAKKIVDQGGECALLAIHDSHVTGEKNEFTSDGKIQVLRLSQRVSWAMRRSLAKAFVEEQKISLLSLQYVCYAFEKRGIVYGLGDFLEEISCGLPWHVMVHEIWLGERLGGSIKEKIVGNIQRFFTLRLFKKLSPKVIHTSNVTYQGCLRRRGVDSKILPMFCTVPVRKDVSNEGFYRSVAKGGLSLNNANREQYLLFGFFGTLFPNWTAEPLMGRLRDFCKRVDKRGVLVSVGSLGAGEGLWSDLGIKYQSDFNFLKIGRVEEGDVSTYLMQMDYGIAATPLELLGKSTSAAAFLEHGVPLIVNRVEPYGLESDGNVMDKDIVILVDEKFEDRLINVKKHDPHPMIDLVVKQFLQDIQ